MRFDVIFGKPSGDVGKEEVSSDNQLYPLPQKDETESKLNAPDNRLGEQFCDSINGAEIANSRRTTRI